MNRYIFSALLSVIVFLIAASSNAAVVYDEAVNGDADHPPVPFTTLTPADLSTSPSLNLILGSNTLNGTISFDVVGNEFIGDRDAFTFSIGSGQEAASINVTASNGIHLNGSLWGQFTFSFYELINGEYALLNGNYYFRTDNTAASFLFDVSQLDAGSYALLGAGTTNASTVGGSIATFNQVDYSFDIELSATTVPLPAGAWLFLSAVSGLAGLRARLNVSKD